MVGSDMGFGGICSGWKQIGGVRVPTVKADRM